MVQLNPNYCQGAGNNRNFQDGCPHGHLVYHNKMILEILNLHVAPNASHQVSAQSDFPLGSRCGFKIFKMAADFSISESLCRSNASHQVSALSSIGSGRRYSLKNFKMAAMNRQQATAQASL